MMNENNIKQMEELLANEEFAPKVTEAGSFENAYKLFTENGMDASYDDFIRYMKRAARL